MRFVERDNATFDITALKIEISAKECVDRALVDERTAQINDDKNV